MSSGAYQNGTFVVGVAKGGVEEGVDSLADSSIFAPSGELLAKAATTGDEVIVAECDLDWCAQYTGTLFDFEKYRRPELYGPIAATVSAVNRMAPHRGGLRARSSTTRSRGCARAVDGSPELGERCSRISYHSRDA